MNKEYFVEMFAYTDWANREVWERVLLLSDEAFFQPLDYSIGSIYEQVVHTMAVEYWWPHYLSTGNLQFLSEDEWEEYRSRAAIRARWDQVSASNQAYAATLTEGELARIVKPSVWEEDRPGMTVAQALTQVILHSMDHRAQTLAMLHTLGIEGVGQDYLRYLNR